MMQKTVLKFMAFQWLARLSRLEKHITDAKLSAPASTFPIFQSLAQDAEDLMSGVIEDKKFFASLLDETALKEATLTKKLDENIYTPYQKLVELSSMFSRFSAQQLLPETHFYLAKTAPSELLSGLGDVSVVLCGEPADGNNTDVSRLQEELNHVLLTGLSVCDVENPSGWVQLQRTLGRALAKKSSPLSSIKKSVPSLDETQLIDTLSHVIGMRLAGPAYYFHHLGQALLSQDNEFIQRVEPLLFYGLNHTNVAGKSAILLHEGLERNRDLLCANADDTVSTLNEIEKNHLLTAVEKMIPDHYAYTENNDAKAQPLSGRLMDQVIISSSGIFTDAEIDRDLQALQTPEANEEGSPTIYDTLTKLTEHPHTPAEMINASWLFSLDRLSAWLFSVFNDSDTNPVEQFRYFQRMLTYQDHLLMKSIETAEIHRVLLCTAEPVA